MNLSVGAGPLVRWQVHWCDPRREVPWYAADPVLAGLPTLAEWAHAHGTQMGQPVLLRADGWSVPEVNGFFASARMRNASAGTRRKYAAGSPRRTAFRPRSSICPPAQ